MSSDKDFKADVGLHQTYVFNLIQIVLDELEYRQATHDKSKLEEPEFSTYAQVVPKLKAVPFGTPEYDQVKAELGHALQHHYEANRHHPEHFPNGVAGMTLIDLLEMICDWMSICRVKETDVRQGMQETMFAKYGITEPLATILLNTVDDLEKGGG